MRLLLVEDNVMNRELFEDVLSAAGHDIVTAANGIDGRDLAVRAGWDLILLDLHLPGASGEEICRSARAAGVRAPIVALSASAMVDEIERAMPAGFDGYLTKPITPSALRAAVRRYGRVAVAS